MKEKETSKINNSNRVPIGDTVVIMLQVLTYSTYVVLAWKLEATPDSSKLLARPKPSKEKKKA